MKKITACIRISFFLLMLTNINVVIAQMTPPGNSFCTATSADATRVYISNVSLNTIDNDSDAQLYSDFTSISTDLNVGATYSITVTPTWPGIVFDEGHAVWIDYNNDADFNDTGELVWTKDHNASSPSTGSFVVPSNATLGSRRMRVIMKSSATPFDPCDTFDRGEVEDYTVNIINPQDTTPPSIPQSLNSLSNTDTTVDLNWSPSTDDVGVVGYDIYQDGILRISVAGTAATVDVLMPETTYTFSVIAKDAVGNNSGASNEISVTTNSSVGYCNATSTTFDIGYIANVALQSINNPSDNSLYSDFTSLSTALTIGESYNITITPGWVNGGDIAGYAVWIDYNGNDSFTDPGEIATIISNTGSPVSLSLNVPNGITEKTTRMRIAMKINVGPIDLPASCETYEWGEVEDYEIDLITVDTEAPSAPTALIASSITATGLFLDWTAATDNVGVVNYEVYQDGVLYGTTTGLMDNIDLLSPETTYSFYVRAKDAEGNVSLNSNTITITTLPDTEAPSQPTDLTPFNVADTSLELSWNVSTDNVGVTSYDVYQNGEFITSVPEALALITNLTPSTTYNYYVIGRDAAGNSSIPSVEISFSTLADTEAPSAPTNLAAFNLTDDAANFTWDASTDNIGVVGYDFFIDDSLFDILTTNSTNLSGLEPATTYIFKVRAKDEAGNVSEFSNELSLTTLGPPPTYCNSQSSNTSDEYISRVTLNTLDNTSGPSFYSDFTSISTNLEVNQPYTMTITPTWTGTSFAEAYAVWIDYNNDFDFDDAGELVFTKSPTTDSPVSNLVIVPTGTSIGPKRMRVSMKYNVIPSSCESFQFGEVEDYTVNIIEPDTTPPSIPQNIIATNITSTSAFLQWDASTDNVGVIQYDLYQDDVMLFTVQGTQVSVADLAPLTTYEIYLRARDLSGNLSDPSEVFLLTTVADTTPPTAPSSVTASNITSSSLQLNWVASTDNFEVTSYDVYENGLFKASASGTDFIVLNLTQDTTYSYYVVAKDAAGNSSPSSNEISITTLDGLPPTIPQNLIATNITETTITLSWDASTDASGVANYELFQDGTLTLTASGTIITINNLTPGTAYAYAVRAKDNFGNVSETSDILNVTTNPDLVPPTTPGNLTVSNITANSANLDWIASTDNFSEVTYDIYQNGVFLETISGIDYVATGLTQFTNYTYFVVARDATGNSSPNSNQVSFTTLDVEPPTVPGPITATNIGTNSLRINWAQSTDNDDVASYQLYRNGVLVTNFSSFSSSSTRNGLTPNTTYIYNMTATDDSGNVSDFSNSISVTTLDTVDCASASTNTNDEYISRVQLNTIDNPSGPSFYSDFTAISTDLFENQTYEVTITPTWTGTLFNEAYSVWIDYNANDDFTDPGEQVVVIQPTQDTPVTASFIVPDQVAIGQVKMRVTLRYNQVPGPCDSFTYGEVEDYSIVLNQQEFEAPTAPISLIASNVADTSVDLSWTAGTDNVGIVAYDVYQSNVLVASVEDLNTTINQLLPNTPYDFVVRSRDGSGNQSPNSNEVTVFTLPDTESPLAPTQLTVTSFTDTTALLNWNEATDNIGVIAYDIYQDGVFLTATNNLEYLVENLTQATTYNFYVVARDAGGNVSENSNTVVVNTLDIENPTAPLNLSVIDVTSNTISLDWNAATDNVGVTNYLVYRGDFLIADVAGNVTSYTVNQLENSTTYSHYVVARDNAGNLSIPSNTVSATTNGTVDCNSGSTQSQDYISRVQLNTIDNTSGISSYTDFTGISTTLNEEQTYTVTITPTWQGVILDYAYAVWIDYNGNNDFTDTGELVWSKEASQDVVNSGVFTIPNGISYGQTKMRVSMRSDQIPNPCESFSNGEVEDYTILLEAPIDVEAPSRPMNLIAENITDVSVDLSWDSATDNVEVISYSIYQNDILIETATTNSANISGLTNNSQYEFYVVANDEAGNISEPSNTVIVETNGEPDIIAGYYFEGSFEGWSDPGENCTRVNWAARSYEGQRSIRLRNGTETSNSVSPILGLIGNNTVTVEFHIYASSMESGETFYLELLSEGVYEIIGAYTSGVDFFNGGFFTDTVVVNSADYNFNTENRLRFRNAGNQNNDQIYFDQVIVRGDGLLSPSIPQMLTASNVQATTVDLSWLASSDLNEEGNAGTLSYDIFQDGEFLATTSQTDYTVQGLEETTEYSFYVIAKDEDGNQSFESETISVTTLEVQSEPIIIAGYYFEDSFEGWSDPGENCTRVNWAARSYEGQRSIRLRNGTETSLSESPILDFTNNNTIAIEFHTYSSSMEVGEAFYVELFNDGLYEIVGTYISGTHFTNGGFFTDTILLSSLDYTFSSSNRIRFRNAGDTSNDQIYFDQVIISGDGFYIPTPPQMLSANEVTATTVDLGWLASTDINAAGNSGTIVYDVYQDEQLVLTTDQIDVTVTNLTENTTYSYYVIARDEDNSQSFKSNTVTITTSLIADELEEIVGYYFETGFEGWSDPGENCTRVNWAARSYEGQRSIRIKNGTETSLSESPLLDLSNNGFVSIEFHTYSSSMESGETFFVELFNNGVYEIIGEYVSGVDFANGTFYTDTILLSSEDYSFALDNRIRFRNTGDTSNDHIYFDQVIISGNGAATSRNVVTNEERLELNNVNYQTLDITLFPNPATSVLNIRSVDGTIEDGAYYTISNLVGQKISTGTIINNRIEINDLKTGVYFLEFNLENRNIVKRFIKK